MSIVGAKENTITIMLKKDNAVEMMYKFCTLSHIINIWTSSKAIWMLISSLFSFVLSYVIKWIIWLGFELDSFWIIEVDFFIVKSLGE